MKRLVSFVALALAAACSARARSDDPSSQDDDVVASDDAFFGHDRVGAALTGHRERIPTTLAEVEALYGIGRACTRADSKEIFVVEETRSRTPAGEVTGEGAMIPRAVVSGCNTGDLADPESVARSTSLFAALVSDPSRAADTSGDGILREPVEVMARDDRTGIYNFYVFAKDERGNPEVTRILRDGATGAVLERRLPSRGRASPAMPPANDSKRCFACHVNGGPLMNEMRDPWTNWISFKKSLPLSRLDGDTKALVSEATPNVATGRSSLANDLEPIMRSAIRAHVSGSASHGGGWAARTLAEPNGLATLLGSLFCETELNYGSATDALPIESFIDPDLNSGDLVSPDAFGDTPLLMPVRSEFDRAVERWLTDQGYVSHEVATAIRLFDDENDVFSDTRCTLKDEAVVAIGAARGASEVAERLRALLLTRAGLAPFASAQPKRHGYLTALLQPSPAADAVDAAFADYRSELSSRFDAMKADTSRPETRARERKARAKAMFAGRSTPLPLLR